jgi:signal transduction histidine kinase
MREGPHRPRRDASADSVTPPPPDSFDVLIVEDDEAIRELVLRTLRAREFRVRSVATAEEALLQLPFLERPVLVLDVMLPGMDGIDLAIRAARIRDDVEVILMTAHADLQMMLRALELGVFRCLQKPFVLEDLTVTVLGAATRLFLRLERRRHLAELEKRNRELEEALAQLRQSEERVLLTERLASIGKFASALGHEINNPLAYVQTGLDMIRQGVSDPAELKTILDDCDAGLRHMRQLSADLGSVARYRVDTATPFDLNEVVSTAWRIARVKATSNTRLVIELAPEPVVVKGASGRLAQVVLNLVSNAIEATEPGRLNLIRVRIFRDDDEAVLEVSDTGCGIPGERLEQIFEPFVTFRAEKGGTGIGLGVVRHVVKELGGRTEVESRVSEGSTFRVRLPAHRAPVPNVEPAGETHRPPAETSILFVDDDPLLRRSLVRALGGRNVRVAPHGVAALACIEESAPDVIVTDIDMPEMSGFELYDHLRERFPELARRVLFVTGQDSAARDAIARRLRVLRKPFGLHELRRAIADLLADVGAG